MAGDTTPQQQAGVLVLEFLIEHFGDALWLLSQHSDEVAQKLADAGLLYSSPVQPKDEDGSLRSGPSAAGPQCERADPKTLAREIRDYLKEGWSCPPDATRMLDAAAWLLTDWPVAPKPTTPEMATAAYLACHARDVMGDRNISTADIADLFRQIGIEVSR